MKRTLLAFLLMAATFACGAQITHTPQGSVDATATALLGKAARKMNNVSFTVTRTLLDSQKKQQDKQSADVKYNQRKYSMTLPDHLIVSDGTTVWHWDQRAGEVVVDNVPATDEVNLFNPGSLLANYQQHFKAKYIRTDDDGTAVVDMQPLSAQSYHKLRLFINETTGALKRLEVHKYDSSREIYDLSNVKYGGAKGPFSFNPSQHPDVEVIDMR